LAIIKPLHKALPPARNGVDTPKLFFTIDHVAEQPELAKFRFRAESRWVDGTHSRSTMINFFGAAGSTATRLNMVPPPITRPCFVVPIKLLLRSSTYYTRCRRA
jgi:hypothetical protein